MFQGSHKSLILSYLGVALAGMICICHAEEPHFDPDKGFKPAQTNLTEIFLQLAESLEHYGHPGPYLRHMKAEHQRIEAAYEAKFGKELVSCCPGYMTDEYVESLVANWDKLAPKLGLEQLAKDSGQRMRMAINGDDGKGTVAILIFNRHQDLVSEGQKIGFDQLRDEFARLIEEGEIPFLVERESELDDAGKNEYQALLEKRRFERTDFPALERFYDGPFDHLSEYGKSQISARTFAGTRPDGTVNPTDAQKFLIEFRDGFIALEEKLDSSPAVSPEVAKTLKEGVRSFFIELGRMAHSELQIGIWSRELK